MTHFETEVLKHFELQREVAQTARALNTEGLTYGYSGNVSVRHPNGRGLLITPSALPYNNLNIDEIPLLGWDGAYKRGAPPSSEWRLHLAIAKACPDAAAIVHCHSPHATALACSRKGIPSFHYMVGFCGGDSIRCTRYAPPGSDELSDIVVEALEGRLACLMGNHGQVAIGKDLPAALYLAGLVEELARIYCATFAIGGPALLSETQMEETIAIFATYGQKKT